MGEMLSVNKKRLSDGVILCNYIKPMQILKKFANNFFC